MQTAPSIFELLFKRNESDKEDNQSFLKEITAQYPYFTPAHFFLLKQAGTGTTEYQEQAARTAVLFNDPFWLNYQLQAGNIKPAASVQQFAGTAQQQAETIIPEQEAQKPEAVPEITAIETMKETAEQTAETTSPIPSLKLPVFDASKHNTLFEPMHMVDYFASQGIKLTEELLSGDKLGKQLRSFTEWLKTMKKVNAPNGPEGGQAETAVQHQAEKSNQDGDVVTESMAEVFAMQGKVKKAIEVYKKLSLLNPDKSAFFAAKINNLKG